MDTQKQSEYEIWRVIVLARDGTEVLLRNPGPGFAFPAVEIPRWERLAENLTASLRTDWGCDAVCLFTPDHSSGDGDHYEVMECLREEGLKKETVWKSIPSLAADSFENGAELRILEQCLHQLDRYGSDPCSPFARRGWLDELRCWTAEVIRPLGLELTGPFCQHNASPSFSLIRFETNGPAVWFKAVGEPNQREFPITLKLSQQFPKYLPELLGTRVDWNGWLSLEAAGTNLYETHEIVLWESAAESLAKLQVESVGNIEWIREAGAHDLGTERLARLVHPFLEVIAQLVQQQTKVPPPALSHQELSLLGVRIEESLTHLGSLGFPEALGHSDLNPGNIVAATDRCAFVDWAEAHIGHPFLSFQYLLEHFRRTLATDVLLESRLARSYCAPWHQLFSGEIIVEALAQAPLAAVFAHAAGNNAWKDQGRLRDPKVAGYFRSLARRMNRDAIRVAERRSPCLS